MQFTQITAVLFLTASLGMAGPLPAAGGNDLATRGTENKLSPNAPTMNKK
ncbi:hypothetical protein M409DRAFT_29906 [Zasmidium cellare ATCC 36951]|uniref:Uncharacterized protein n=1 Tax=Zasmidium cellare ATCC 36951 TaxID=1080233 RepID=A0A6A6C1K0_ZASCE|nr:uncharacterized protein M409DRAFT_29906 [Zasmidium cellare ATCC 36951]KAF2159586.1 hypothetical protein M409DRAFT_29906 [Zasmidium cellare ATCC 36951]